MEDHDEQCSTRPREKHTGERLEVTQIKTAELRAHQERVKSIQGSLSSSYWNTVTLRAHPEAKRIQGWLGST